MQDGPAESADAVSPQTYIEVPASPALARALWWSTFAGGVAALVMAVTFVAVGGLVARWAYGVRLSESLRLGLPELAALGSFAVILILFWATLQPVPGIG